MSVQDANCKVQALVYNVLPPATAIVDYAIGLGKLSANEQFFVDAQMVVSLEQTIQIIAGISFITTHVAYTITNKDQNCLNWDRTLFLIFFKEKF